MKKRAISDDAKDARREQILMAALEQFYLNGFSATRMDAISNQLGISKGTLYLYFPSKEAIFEALIQSVALPKMNMIEQGLMQAESVQKGLARLFATAPYMVRHSPLPKVIKVLISDAFAFPEVIEHYRTNIISKALNALESLLKRGQASGEINIESAAMTARLVVAPVIFSVIWTVVFEKDKAESYLNVESLFAQHQRLLFAGLGISQEQVQ